MKQLTMSLVPGPLTDPIVDGTIAVDGAATFTITRAPTVDKNSREMLHGAYDVAEMSFSTYIKAKDLGRDLIGLPIFTGRGFLQPGITCSVASGITRPEELAGKRVAIPQFWMTSTVWHRLILEQQYGLHDDAISWFASSPERFSELPPSDGVSLQRLEDGLSLQDALGRGLVDATMVPPRGVSKTQDPATRSPFADLPAAQRAYFASTGIFPIMHFVVLRASLAEQLPWLPGALTVAFTEAKRRAEASAALPAGEQWAFGLADNAAALDAFFSFARSKAWVSAARSVPEYFVRS